jgi:hypothetical protein
MLVGVSPIDVSKRNAEAVLTTGTDNCESDICVEQETVNTPLSRSLDFLLLMIRKLLHLSKRRGILLGYGKFA